jgi:hypothetical protein
VTTYKIHWQWRDRSLGSVTVFAALSQEEQQALSSSLKEIKDYVDVSRFRIEKIDASTINQAPLSAADARKEIASKLGISQLP